MLGSKASVLGSKDQSSLLLGANASGDFNLKQMLIYHSQNRRAFKNSAKSALPLFYKWKNKIWIAAHLLTISLTISSPLLRSDAKGIIKVATPNNRFSRQTKQLPFAIVLLTDHAPGHPKSPMEMYHNFKVVFMTAITTSILKSMGQRVIFTFKSYWVTNTFHKAIAAMIVIPVLYPGKVN